MPYHKNANGRYEVSVCVRGKRVHRRLPEGAGAGDAKQLEAELRAELKRERPVNRGSDPLLSVVLQDYLDKHVPTLRSPDTATYHALRLGRWVEGRRASETRQVVAQIADDMHGHYKPATINRSLGALSKALSRAWKLGQLAADYSALVERLPERNERTTYLSLDQVKTIASKASEQVQAAIWLSLYTGCRRGEVLKIKPADVQNGVIRIHAGNTKTMKYREVPIAPAAQAWLNYVPLSISFEGVKTGFQRARKAAEMPHVHFHDLRRSCGTILLQAGVPLHVVSKILGHSSVRVTESRYAFLDAGQMRDAVAQAFGEK